MSFINFYPQDMMAAHILFFFVCVLLFRGWKRARATSVLVTCVYCVCVCRNEIVNITHTHTYLQKSTHIQSNVYICSVGKLCDERDIYIHIAGLMLRRRGIQIEMEMMRICEFGQK